MIRTHNNNQLTSKDINKKVILQGFVNKVRKMGKKIFIDLRDMYGVTQIVFEDDTLNLANEIKNEYVIQVNGKVIKRLSPNKEIHTGEIEVLCEKLEIINSAKLTPFEIKDDLESNEDTRLRHRYLDLRRNLMKDNLLLKSKLYSCVRNYFTKNEFIEIGTPTLGKASPEGARDFILPSRLNKGSWYALPQSPQLYKQLFMVAGIDKYYQIARCYRDEDLRNDRQLEFDQLDFELSFAKQEDVVEFVDGLTKDIFKNVMNLKIKEIPRIKFSDSIEKYGVDKPDIRFELYIHSLNSIFKGTEFVPFQNKNKSIRGIAIDKILAKKEIESLGEIAKQNNCEFFSFIKYENKEWAGALGSKLSDKEKTALIKEFNLKTDSTILFVCDKYLKASAALGSVRNTLGATYNLYNKDEYKPCFIIDFPLFEWSDEENRFVSAHNPFTMPNSKYIENFETKKEEALAASYDLVINGYEIGSGAERITNRSIQNRMFKAIELSDKTIKDNFGWFLEAYEYGAPYHAGMALGLDRISMLFSKTSSIREVIAFPKNSNGVCLMTNSPSEVDQSQINDVLKK